MLHGGVAINAGILIRLGDGASVAVCKGRQGCAQTASRRSQARRMVSIGGPNENRTCWRNLERRGLRRLSDFDVEELAGRHDDLPFQG
jgi:hypothetical protein